MQDAKARYAKLILDEDVQHWHDHGYVVIERFLRPDELTDVHAGIQQYMPTYEEYKAHPYRYKGYYGAGNRGSNGNEEVVRQEFPYGPMALNETAMHPFLVAFSERLAGTDKLSLSHGAITGKYAGKGNYDQPLHADYSGNTYVIPQKSTEWLDIPMIIYHSDVTIDLGPTYVVSQKHTEHRKLVEDGFRFHRRDKFPELYEVEQPNLVPAGSVLIYQMRTFHRGSALNAKDGARFIQFTAFHTANIPWMGSMFHQNKMGAPEMLNFIQKADPSHRTLLGFPPVGHAYWKDDDARTGVANRYPDMDMTPYGGGKALNAVNGNHAPNGKA